MSWLYSAGLGVFLLGLAPSVLWQMLLRGKYRRGIGSGSERGGRCRGARGSMRYRSGSDSRRRCDCSRAVRTCLLASTDRDGGPWPRRIPAALRLLPVRLRLERTALRALRPRYC
jgi:hypothetical protein